MKIFEIIGISAASSSSGYYQNPYSHDLPVDKKKKSKADKEKKQHPKPKSTNKDRGTVIDIEV